MPAGLTVEAQLRALEVENQSDFGDSLDSDEQRRRFRARRARRRRRAGFPVAAAEAVGGAFSDGFSNGFDIT